MSAGAYHYKRAERLLEEARGDGNPQYLLSAAQVHATLAQVALAAELAVTAGTLTELGEGSWRRGLYGPAVSE